MIVEEYPHFDIQKIAESGQCFRLNRIGDHEWLLIAFGKVLHIIMERKGRYCFSCGRKEFESLWKDYFDLETDYGKFAERIPKKDLFLQKAAAYSDGIRILRQDPWEILISFIISQRKSIPAIQTSVEKLSAAFGKKIPDGTKTYYAFPRPEELSRADYDDILACSVGYRAPYIYRAAKMCASGELDLMSLSELDDAALREKLLSVNGVGEKVAGCVMLFGYHRTGAFPVDVWIQRMMDLHYDGHFPIKRYRGFAGIIQQYIFYYGRQTYGRSERMRKKIEKLDKKGSLI
jgi:N-glycosylase/DNA lyase